MLFSFADGVDIKQVLANHQAQQIIDRVTYYTRKLLPTDVDVPKAAKMMAVQSVWDSHSIEHFTSAWKQLNPQQAAEYKQTRWFKEFSLAMSLQLAQSEQLAGLGNAEAKRQVWLISILKESVDGKDVKKTS